MARKCRVMDSTVVYIVDTNVLDRANTIRLLTGRTKASLCSGIDRVHGALDAEHWFAFSSPHSVFQNRERQDA
jgi:hypothetical protein